ncbi:MAG: serine protein kinase PrkA [Planctomycetota bacterium]
MTPSENPSSGPSPRSAQPSPSRAVLRIGIGAEEDLVGRAGNGDGKRPDAHEILGAISSRTQSRFAEHQQILSYGEFLDRVLADPRNHVRAAAQYVRDTFEYFGTRVVRGVEGPITRFNLFDAPFNAGRDKVWGQEEVQNEVYKILTAFCEKGRIDKLIMLHGPNGSAKSTFMSVLMGGLEYYSRQPEGALYKFNWIFSDNAERDVFGFHKTKSPRPDGSLAYLDPDEITFKLTCEMRDDPLLVIPRDERLRILEEAFVRKGIEPRIPDAIARGELCQKCQEIYISLENAYKGDWQKIVQHIQVERLYVSKRYRQSAVVIEPQRNVDAATRPLNLEKSYQIPPILNQSNMHEAMGDLIDSNRGVVEYSDFFKRPLEINKYLLTTSEKGTISLPNYMAYLDVVLFATSNEKQLTVFKRDPDFSSFKGRIELVKCPYLLRWTVEEKIYREHIRSISGHKHVAPHSAAVVALWSVLTRLKRPRSKHYKSDLGALVSKLRPLQKAYLYDRGEAPEDWKDQERKELLANLDKIAREFRDEEEEFEGMLDAAYEGRRGSSAREIQTLLNDATLDQGFRCLSPLAIFKAIREMCADRSVYDFLRLEADAGYGDIERLTDDVEREYRHWVQDEVQDSCALIEEKEYERVFEDYFVHVKAFDSSEKVKHRQTGQYEPANEELMNEVENVIGIKEKPNVWRKQLIMRIAGWAIDNPGRPIPYHDLFRDIFKALKQAYYKKREASVAQIEEHILRFGTDDWISVPKPEQKNVKRSLARMKVKYGYCELCAKEVLSYVLKHREA